MKKFVTVELVAAEVVQITYDKKPKLILMKYFSVFTVHDPTTLNRHKSDGTR
jgi:peptide methionine sulfoxide reductase MsrA